MSNRSSVVTWHRVTTRVVLMMLAVMACSGALIGIGAGLAGADPATEKAAVPPGYQALVEAQKDALCIGNEPSSNAGASGSGASGGSQPGDSLDPSSPPAAPAAGETPAAGGDANICGDKTEDLWKAAAKCAKGETATTKDDIKSEDEKKFIDCMADEKFGEKDKAADEPTSADSEQMAKLTLGRVSASLTAFYVNELSPAAAKDDTGDADKDEAAVADAKANGTPGEESKPSTGLAAWGSLLAAPSMAGAFVGSLDRSKGESNEWLFGPGNSANTAEIKYSAFNRDLHTGGFLGSTASDSGVGIPTAEKGGDPVPDGGTQGYLTYGAMLGGLGLDTAVDKDAGLSGLLAAPGPRGYVLLLAYMGAGFLDTVFDSVLEALQFLNPFRFMVDAITGNYGADAGGKLGDPVEGEPDGGFAGLQDAFGKIYNTLLDVGWLLVVPVLLIMLGFSAVFLKSAGTGGKVKKLVIVVMFMAIGLPVFGGLYTAALTSMASSDVGSAKGASTKIVLSTLVDFESWVGNSRLTPPAGSLLGWSMSSNSPVPKSEGNVRKFALEINTSNNKAFAGVGSNTAGSTNGSGSDDSRWASENATANSGSAGGSATDQGSLGESMSAFSATRDLLLRYAKSSPVTASGFESQVKSAMISLNNVSGTDGKAPDKDASQKAVLAWFEQLSDPAALAKMSSDDVAKLNNPLIQVSTAGGEGGGSNGAGLQANVGDDTWAFKGTRTAKPEGDECHLDKSSGVVGKDWTPDSTEPGVGLLPCNLSIMSMYNYLNTSFGPSSMETFSPEQTLNAYSRTNHASVTAVGAGPAGLLYFFSALSVLGSFVIIGFGYALSMLFSTLKRGFHLMGAVLAAATGVLSGIAKVMIYTAAMLLEVLGTLFLYKLVQELILLVPALLEKPLASKLNTPGGALDGLKNADEGTQAAVGTASTAVLSQLSDGKSLGIAALLVTLIGMSGVIMFTVIAMKMRRGLLDSIDQAVTNIVNKFTETSVSAGMDPGQPGALRQGLGRGVSMGAQSLMMGGAMGAGGGGDVGEGDGDASAAAAAAGGSDTEVAVPDGDGARGVNGDGSMAVGPDGAMNNAAGDPVMSKAGSPMRLDSFVPVDSSSGHLLDGPGGSPVIGSDGSEVDSSDISGFNADGALLNGDGAPMTDADGNTLTSTSARSASGHLMGAEALAQRVSNQGGLSAMSPNLGSAGPQASAPQAAAASAPTQAPTGPKALGEVPSSDHAMNGGHDRSFVGTAAASSVAGVLSQKISGQRKRKNWGNGGGPGGGSGGGQPPRR